MLHRKRLPTLLIPAVLCLGACAAHETTSSADNSATDAAAAMSDARIARHLQELTSDSSEQLSRRNGIESEPEKR